MSLNRRIQRQVNGIQSKLSRLTKKKTPRPRKKRERRKRSRLKLMVSKRATMFNSEFVPRTREDLVNLATLLMFTRFDQRR